MSVTIFTKTLSYEVAPNIYKQCSNTENQLADVPDRGTIDYFLIRSRVISPLQYMGRYCCAVKRSLLLILSRDFSPERTANPAFCKVWRYLAALTFCSGTAQFVECQGRLLFQELAVFINQFFDPLFIVHSR